MPLPQITFVRQKFSRFGGGELILNRTIEALSSRAVSVSLVAREWEPLDGVTFHRCDPARSPRSTRDSRFAKSACEIIRALSDTLVQSHERLACCDIFRAGDGVHAAYLEHRARNLGWLHRLFQRISGYHRDVVRMEREMFASPRLKAVIVNAEMVAEEIITRFDYPRARIHLIPNGIDLTRFSKEKLDLLREDTRARLGISGDRKTLVIIGSGYERKGVAQAIRALARSGSRAVLLVVGHEKRVSRYRTLARRLGIKDDVRFLGRQTDIIPFLAAADAMILPSVYDPFPSATLEAFAAGLPVITSTTCGARDIAREIDSRLVRDASDIDGLSEAIGVALALSEHPSTAIRAREIAARFDMDRMVGRMLALYEKLAEERTTTAA